MQRPARFRPASVASLLGCLACSSKPAEAPSGSTVSAACRPGAAAGHPLVVDWQGRDRADLESALFSGVVAVHYDGCTVRVLTGCSGAPHYAFVAAAPKLQTLEIASREQLRATLPVGAARLESTLDSAGPLAIELAVVGKYELSAKSVAVSELRGTCDGATHFVSRAMVGAFRVAARRAESTSAGAKQRGSAAAANARGGTEVTVHEDARVDVDGDGDVDGDVEICKKPTEDRSRPRDGCGALLGLEVVPLLRAALAERSRPDSPAAPPATSPAPAPAVEGRASCAASSEGKEEACCRGRNECKGKGSCKVENEHDCAGMNDCKGHGGCRGHCPE